MIPPAATSMFSPPGTVFPSKRATLAAIESIADKAPFFWVGLAEGIAERWAREGDEETAAYFGRVSVAIREAKDTQCHVNG
jgi:hypothetical protein